MSRIADSLIDDLGLSKKSDSSGQVEQLVGFCLDGKYKGQQCNCADCRHEDAACIDHAGGGCAACEGPVSGCYLTNYK